MGWQISYPSHLQTITKAAPGRVDDCLEWRRAEFYGACGVQTADVTTRKMTAATVTGVGKIAIAGLLLCAAPVPAQVIVSSETVYFSVVVDRGELRETMRREHRERLERGLANRANHRPPGNFGQTDSNQRESDAQRDQREAENAERRARWQRMSPDERQQMRRDINQAGRNIYPQNPRREGE